MGKVEQGTGVDPGKPEIHAHSCPNSTLAVCHMGKQGLLLPGFLIFLFFSS